MATIEVTPEQKRELASKGYAVKPVYDVVSNRRSYWDPRKDEKGRVFGWTRPLPGDSARMNFYMRKGFRLEDPDGNMGPPPGYFRARSIEATKVPSTKPKEVGTGSGEIVAKGNGETPALRCPICQRDFPDTDTLVHHMIYHRSTKAKKNGRKLKRGKSKRLNKEVN